VSIQHRTGWLYFAECVKARDVDRAAATSPGDSPKLRQRKRQIGLERKRQIGLERNKCIQMHTHIERNGREYRGNVLNKYIARVSSE
jgi:hypothetical protein